MTKERDPLGKRALFSGAERTEPVAAPAAPVPKRPPGPLDVKVECSACHETSIVSAPEIAFKHLPVLAWLPWRKRSLLMRCPACSKLAWHSASRA